MFAGLRKFQRIIWLVAAVVIIPPFVIFFSPNAAHSFRGEGGSADFGRLDGKPISRETFLEARQEAYLRLRRFTGQWPQDGQRLDEFTYYQILIAAQIRDLGIHVSPDAVAREALAFGIGDMSVFMKNLPRSGLGITKVDVMRYLEHEAAFRELGLLASAGSQLIPPSELESRFRKQHDEVVVEGVFFSGSSYTNGIALTPDVLGRHYTNYQSSYRIPERLQLAYVQFPKSNFFAQADAMIASRTNLQALLDGAYQSRGGTNYTDPKNPSVVLSEKEAKAKILEEFRGQSALMSAFNQATEVADKMMSGEDLSVKVFETSMAAAKLPVLVSSPFDRSQAPAELKGVPAEIAGRVFELTNSSSAILTMPVMGEDAVYLVAVKNRLPSQVEPFASVRSRVAEDYLRTQGNDLATKAGIAFHSTLTNQLAAGKSFAEAAAAGKHRIETLPPFSLSTESLPELAGRLDLNQLKNLVSTLSDGGVSRFVYARNGGAVLRLRERRPLAPEVRAEKFESFAQEQRFQHINDAVSKYFEKVSQARLQRPVSAKDAADAAQGADGAAN